MKLPNGYGSVYKLSGKRRNPWIARKTTGWILDDNGKPRQQYATIGYYPTKTEAMTALGTYNADPYDLKADKITFKEVYDKWADDYFENIVPSAVRTIKSAYNHSAPLHNMVFRDIKVIHLEKTIHDAQVGSSTKARMKSLYNMLYRYALKHEICDKNYAALCDSVKREAPLKKREPFTDEELTLLWSNIDFPFVDMVIIGIYTGFRPQELAILKVEDVDLENMTIKGGMKTDAGKNRIVPIHSKIYDLVKKNYDNALAIGSNSLFNDPNGQQGTTLTYDKYRGRFVKICQHLGIAHRPHDTRHTFITLAKRYQMDEYMIKLIVGHAITDITEKVYTHRTLEQLKNEIEKIKV